MLGMLSSSSADGNTGVLEDGNTGHGKRLDVKRVCHDVLSGSGATVTLSAYPLSHSLLLLPLRRWRMPKELAIDLASLALYDIVLFVDDSGSMAFEENGERIDDLKLISSKVAEVATMFDDDGILMRFMNSPVDGSGLRYVDVLGHLCTLVHLELQQCCSRVLAS
jgi:hypothetical protein